MKAITLALVSCGLLLGCAGADEGPIGHIRFHGAKGTEYRVTRDSISNEKISISRVKGTKTFRGIGENAAEIELRAEGSEVKGEVSSAPIELKIEPSKGPVTVVHGLFAGHLMNFHLFHGDVNCAYRFDEKEDGRAESCANQYSVELPPEVNALPIDEQAAFVAVTFYR